MKYRARLKPIIVLVCGLCAQAAWPAASQNYTGGEFYYRFLDALTRGNP